MDALLSKLETPTLRVYLASRFENAPPLRQIRDEELHKRGIWVTSRWLAREKRADHLCADYATTEFKRVCANEDIEDIEQADILVLDLTFDREGYTTYGCIIEAGYALGMGVNVIVIGDNGSVFWALPEVYRCDSWTEAIALMEIWNDD